MESQRHQDQDQAQCNQAQCSADSRPATIICPGQLVEAIMNNTYVSREQAARRLGLSLEDLDRFYKGDLALTKELSFKLRDATGYTASHWMGIETLYRKRLAKWQEQCQKNCQ